MTKFAAQSTLVRAALSSGLVPIEVLQRIFDPLIAGLGGTPTDTEIGRVLIAEGLLNPWQVEQLKEGRTKFSLGPYRIFDALGKGGMGHVFKARHEILGRIEAIKVLPRNKTNAETIAGFQREVRTQAQLDHPNLVRVLYADHEADTHYFVTEFVPGSDLRRLVRTVGPLSAGAAAQVVKQAAEGLEYAHRHGLVHRDVKPGNLLIAPDGRTKVIDLGLAWYFAEMAGQIGSGERPKIVGTPDYLAPETIRQPERVMPVSDVYAMGCTLYYAVTGKVPFPGGNALEKMQRHLHEAPIGAEQLNPSLTVEFIALLSLAMHKNPRLRVPTAAALAEALDPFISPSSLTELQQAISQVDTRDRGLAQGGRPAPGPRLDETLSYDDESPATRFGEAIESPSQTSQGTTPVVAATIETHRDLTSTSQTMLVAEPPQEEDSERLPLAVTLSLMLGAIVLLTVIAALVAVVMSPLAP